MKKKTDSLHYGNKTLNLRYMRKNLAFLAAILLLFSCGGKEVLPEPDNPVVVVPDDPDTPDEPDTPDDPDEPDEPETPSWTKSEVFDEGSIVFSLGAFSDVHIGNGYNSEAKFTNALNQLKAKAAEHDPDGLDATMFVGDIANTNSTSQAQTFINLYENILKHNDIPLIYTPGNHDINDPLRDVMDDSYFTTVDSTHILCLLPRKFSPMTYDPVAVHWLDTTLASVTARAPEKYVMVITHPMIYNTCYGSLLGEFWYTKGLSSVLVKYPQAVVFGGHLHFPLNDPRSIWQGDFTSMGCGSCSYMAIEDGKYEDMKSATVMKDAGEFSQGLLLQFDRSGNVRIHRMDYYHNATIGEPWEISYPRADKTHLQRYNHAALSGHNSAPVLSTMEFIQGEESDSLRFAAGTDDEFVHHYVITIKKDGAVLTTKRILSDWYRHPRTSGMRKVWTRPLGKLPGGSYDILLTAYDSWDAVSNTLVQQVSIKDPTTLWVTDAAGSCNVEGGSGDVTEDWLKYDSGKVEWTANTTGLPRVLEITLPNGTKCKVIQVSEDDFRGEWKFYSKVFHLLGNYISSNSGTSQETKVRFGEPLDATLNNIGIRGLAGTAEELVMDARLSIDYENRSARLGLFFDGRKAQKILSGSHAGGYAAFLPELTGKAWANDYFEFGRTQIGTPNYDWVRLALKVENGRITATLVPFTEKVSVSHDYAEDYIIGIELMHFNSDEISDAGLTRGTQTFTHVPGQTNSAAYLVIHQANYKDSQSGGMYFVKE